MEMSAPDVKATYRVLRHIDACPSLLQTEEYTFVRDFVERHAKGSCPFSTDEDGSGIALEGASDEEEAPPPPTSDEMIWLNAEIEKNPSSRNYVKRGSQFLNEGTLESAVTDAEQALALNPDSAPALRLRARVRHVLDENDAAYKDMSDAQRIDYDEEYDTLHAQMKVDRDKSISNAAGTHKHDAEPSSYKCSDAPSPFDLTSLMNNPAFMSMAQDMMSKLQSQKGM